MHNKNSLTTPKCKLSNAMLTTKSHIHIDANSPMLRQGIVPNANRGHYEGGRVGAVERGVDLAMSGGKH